MDILFEKHKLHIGLKYQQNSSELVVFLHGLGANKDAYQDVWNYPQFEKFSLLTVDYIGFGDSSKPDNFSYTMEDQAKVLLKLLEHYKEQRVHLAIHSMGGVIGVLLAEQLGSRLGKILNLEGNLVAEDCGVMSRQSAVIAFEEFTKIVFPRLLKAFGASKHPGEHHWPEKAKQANPFAFQKSAQSLVTWSDNGKILQKFLSLNAQKYYFFGEISDQWAASGKRLQKVFNEHNIPMIGIAEGTHFMMNDNPDEFYTKLFVSLNI